MSSYTIHFIIALILSEIAFCFFHKGTKRLYFILGLIAIPVLSYGIFYNDSLIYIKSRLVLLIAYCGSFWLTYSYSHIIKLLTKENLPVQKEPHAKKATFFALQAILLLLLFLFPWAVSTFPLSNFDAVLFTFFAPIDGSGEFVIKTLKEKVFISCATSFFVILTVQLVLGTILKRLFLIEKEFAIFLLGCVLANLLIIPSIMHSPAFKVFFESSVDSKFYSTYYIEPSNAQPPQTDSKKNLVVIFVESMANNFNSYTPELNYWKQQGINFIPGGESVAGTSWTIAGITAALCGIPLNLPMNTNEYHGRLPTYLPGATCLSDRLKDIGYNQVFIQGSNADFTQKREFWTSHGNVSIRDDQYYKKQKKVSQDYNVFWGIEDKKMFSFAKEELSNISLQDKPFAAYILTVDTHQPNGYLDSSCSNNENTPYKNALRCSSFMIDEFLNWMKEQPWYDNTIVFVTGDHTIQALATKAGLNPEEELFTTAFLLNAKESHPSANRRFSNLDYPATILDAMGWNLPSSGYGLGKSLFSQQQTLLDIFGRDSLDILLRQRSLQYDVFLRGN